VLFLHVIVSSLWRVADPNQNHKRGHFFMVNPETFQSIHPLLYCPLALFCNTVVVAKLSPTNSWSYDNTEVQSPWCNRLTIMYRNVLICSSPVCIGLTHWSMQ